MYPIATMRITPLIPPDLPFQVLSVSSQILTHSLTLYLFFVCIFPRIYLSCICWIVLSRLSPTTLNYFFQPLFPTWFTSGFSVLTNYQGLCSTYLPTIPLLPPISWWWSFPTFSSVIHVTFSLFPHLPPVGLTPPSLLCPWIFTNRSSRSYIPLYYWHWYHNIVGFSWLYMEV